MSPAAAAARALRYGLWLALPMALAWGLRGSSLEDLARAIGALSWIELLILLAVNALVVLALSGRWWALLRGRSIHISYLALSAYRLAAFAVSYFTPGTHFGGEPLQVHLVQRRHGVELPVATASVVLDKTIEMLANFGFLAIGLATVAGLGLAPEAANGLVLAVSLALLLVPLVYLVVVWRGRRPASRLAAGFGVRSDRDGRLGRVARWLEASEDEVRGASRGSPSSLVAAAGFSVLSWLVLLAEWWLLMSFLDIAMSPARVIAVVTAARLALFVPLPGAAGALEAALLLGMERLGFGPAQALGLALVIRARDLAFGAIGLWLGGWLAGSAPGVIGEEAVG